MCQARLAKVDSEWGDYKSLVYQLFGAIVSQHACRGDSCSLLDGGYAYTFISGKIQKFRKNVVDIKHLILSLNEVDSRMRWRNVHENLLGHVVRGFNKFNCFLHIGPLEFGNPLN